MALNSFFPPAVFEIQAVATEAIATFAEVNHELGVMETKATAAGTSLTKLQMSSKLATGALLGIGAAMVGFGVFAVKAVLDSEKAFARLDTALQNSHLATKENVESFRQLSEANTKLGFETGATASALGTLVTATGNVHDSQMLLNTAMDYARYKHIDLETAATTLARATTGSAKAFRDLGITLDTTLPKQQGINKAMDEFNAKVKGQNAAYLETFSGKLNVFGAEAKLAGEKIGGYILPVLTTAMDFITKFGKDILIFVGILGGVALVFKTVEIATGLATTANAFYAAALVAVADAEAVAAADAGVLMLAEDGLTISTRLAAGAMGALSLAMDANPIGVVLIAVLALTAAFVALYKVINSGDISPTSYDGKKGHWVTSGKGGRAFVPDAVQPSTAYDPLSGMTPDSGKYSLSGMTGADAAKTAAAKLKAQLEALKKNKAEVTKLYAEMNKVVSDALDQQNQLFTDKNDRDIAAQNTFTEDMFKINRTFNEDKFKLDRDSADKVFQINRSFEDSINAANKTYDDKVKADTIAHDNALLSINKDYEQKALDITQSFADKKAAIIQKSKDLLINAFASATSVNIGDIFASASTGIDGVLKSLQEKLLGAKTLADNAAKLAAQGYSQTFIQQVVSQGPDVGNKFADAILNATPEAATQLKDLYAQIQAVSETGVNGLADQMSTGASLATKALTDEYVQAGLDIQAALAKNSTELQTALANENTSFAKSIADADKTLADAKASANLTLNESLADAKKTYDDALFDMNTRLADSTRDAKKTLEDALIASAKTFDDSVAQLQKDTMKRLSELQAALAETAAQIAAVSGKSAGVQIMAGSPAAGYLAGTSSLSPTTPSVVGGNEFGSITINNTNNGVTTSPAEIATATLNAVLLGQTQGITSARSLGVASKAG